VTHAEGSVRANGGDNKEDVANEGWFYVKNF
jgi:hypothetical protein